MAGTAYVTAETLARRTRGWIEAALLPPARRRSLPALERAALLVVDVQRYFADPTSHAYLPALAPLLPHITRLIHSFREAGRPVVLTRHGSASGDPTPMRRWWHDELRQGEARAELLETLEPRRATLVLDKQHYSAFLQTELRAWLQAQGCEVLVIAGVMTHLCCETTARDGFMRGLEPVLVADACAAPTEELHLGALRALAHGFAVIAPTADVLVALDPATATSEALAPQATVPRRCDLAVIGAGPAGTAAAIQAQRAGIQPVLLDRATRPGLAATANLIENYPGFPGGVGGATLAERFAAQAAAIGVEPLLAEVTAVERAAGALVLDVAGRHPLRARAVIVATGTRTRTLPALESAATDPRLVDRVDALGRLGGRRLLLVGGGEAALDQALFARRRGAGSVTVVIRGQAPRAMSLLVDRARRQGVELLTGCTVSHLVGDLDALTVHLELDGRDEHRAVDAVVTCIGRRPTTPQLPATLARRSDGTPRVDRLGRTSEAGLYLAGDARRGIYRQVGIAVGDGLAAAMHAARFLAGEGWTDGLD